MPERACNKYVYDKRYNTVSKLFSITYKRSNLISIGRIFQEKKFQASMYFNTEKSLKVLYYTQYVLLATHEIPKPSLISDFQ